MYHNLLKNLSVTLLLLFVILSYTLVEAQNQHAIDSLQRLVLISSGSDKSEVLYQLARETISSDKAASLHYAEEGLALAKEIGDSLKIVKGTRLRGQVLRRLDRIVESIDAFHSVLGIAKRHETEKDYFEEYKFLINGLALSYTYYANYDKALEYNFLSLTIREKEGKKGEMSDVLNNIGLVYFKLRNYEKAIEFYTNALKLKNEINDTFDLDRLLINLALAYNQVNKYEEAEKYTQQAFVQCNDNCSDQIKMEGQLALGVSSLGLQRLEESNNHFMESLEIAKRIDSKRFVAENLIYLAKLAIERNAMDEAIKFLQESEKLAALSGYNEMLIDTYRQFSILYNKTLDFKNAAVYQNKYISLKDSIYSEALIKNIAKIQTDYAERENIATIAAKEQVIKQQRDLNIAVAVIAILAGLLVLVLQRSNRTIKRVNAQLSEAKEVIEEQNKLLESKNKYLDKEVETKTEDLERVNQSLKQVNDELDNFIYKTSHDIRGPLASLKGMCNVALMDVKDPVALDYLSKLDTTAERLNTILTRLLIINQINNSKLSVARIDFENIVNDVLLLEKKKGLPQKLRIQRNIHNQTTILSDKELIRIVLENLIDNAIKFYNDSDRVDSFVEIHISSNEQGQVKVRVIDNGIGISEANPGKLFRMFFRASERSETGGIGLYIVKTATAKLGGRVGLLTTPEGFTEFYVVFPSTPPKQDDDSEKPSI
ncbi:MAG TPA: ATP-binding protein [Ohtaekwangia sp.]|uniref:ATP-binding protein n=1 Tax=Ohtaekwangia sp. TaxID=2066019 RepID=UPI002F91F01C